jgi:hypothetical protein
MESKRTINYWINLSMIYCCIQLLSVFLFIIPTLNAQQVQCSLQKEPDSLYVGFCQCKDSLIFSLTLKPKQGNKTGIWKGKSSTQASANDPVFLEITSQGGTLATVYRSGVGLPCGWYDISNLEMNNTQLKFTFNLQVICKPQSRDVTILKKARAHLPDSTKWNRNDNRSSGKDIYCEPNSNKKTIFCALYSAQTDILGDFYGGPSFWALIREIQELGKYQHPIQAFNNDLKASFNMLQKVFDDAINKASQTLDCKQ